MIDIDHAMNVSDISRRIGAHMKLGEFVCSLLAVAGMFHDIGKVGIPGELLNKQGSLTPDEYKVIQWHTTVGHLLLSQMPDDIHKAAAEVALYHHERLDGSGYIGLRGTEIPLTARIVGVADVFAALLAQRTYRKAWALETTLEYMTGHAGKLFEPKIVDALAAAI